VNETRYPLCWPANWKRATSRTRAAFGKAPRGGDGQQYIPKARLSIDDSFRRIETEMERFGIDVQHVVVSTNLRTNLRGLPTGAAGEPRDPGVAVYWKQKGKAQCMAIDRYDRVADNLAAVAATLEALRAIERHGGGEILDRTFIGFAQLASGERPWRDVLGFPAGSILSAAAIETQFRSLAKQRHPDQNPGDHSAMAELNLARTAALAEVSQ
jgi:hypothetical protein